MTLNQSLTALSANCTKWSDTLNLSVFDHFVGLALKGLNIPHKIIIATAIIIITIIIKVAKEKLTHLNSLLHIYT